MDAREPLDPRDRDHLLALGFRPDPSPEPAPEAVEAALAAIAARPETDLPEAAAKACFYTIQAAQADGATSADGAAMMLAFIAARERLEAEAAVARLLP